MVFQSYALYPHMTVEQNLGFGLRMGGMPRDQVANRVSEAARILEISELLQRKPRQLSGGQRQRVAIGRAIVREPRIFLFDEPLSNLDAELRLQMRVELANLHNSLDSTMIYVTHDQVEAMTMADKIVVLRAGLVEQVGAPLELYNRPANLFVAGFLGAPRMNFLPAEVAARDGARIELALPGGHRLTQPAADTSLAPGARLTLGIRPEHLTPAADGQGLAVVVDVVEHLGSGTAIYGRLAEQEGLTIVLPGQHAIRPGQRLNFAMGADACHLFDADGGALPRPA
jgi:multiple sugar transport system ATP-binding protein